MTDQALDTEMAEEVMGWRESILPVMFGVVFGEPVRRLCWVDAKGEAMMPVDDWHPTSDIRQAFECLWVLPEKDKIKVLALLRQQDYSGWTGGFIFYRDLGRKICLAIHGALKGVENDIP